MHILFLTPWYPNRHDAMDGLFVAKHAQAAARQGAEVTVIRVRTDETAKAIEIESCERDGVLEILVYTPASKIPILRQITAIANFARGFARAYRMAKRLRGKPDVTQVNILTRMGVMGYILKQIEGIPYVIIEHWGRYQPSRGQYYGFARKRATELVCRNAHCVMTVSDDLARVMRKCGIKAKEWKVVHNVVNDFFYNDRRRRLPDGICHLLSVTTPDERCKNNTGIVRSLARVAATPQSVRLTIAGIKPDTIPSVGQAVKDLGLADIVTFVGEVQPEQISRLMHESDALVMFSNSENAPCVISEALASGTPVIATAVGGIPEMVSPSVGILVSPGDEPALANAIEKIASSKARFDEEALKEAGKAYCFSTVGRQLTGIYAEAMAASRPQSGRPSSRES